MRQPWRWTDHKLRAVATMKQLLSISIACLLSATLNAQCTMTAWASTTQMCSYPFSTSVSVNGGTPPYSITVDWYSVNTFVLSGSTVTTNPFAALIPPTPPYTYGANLTQAIVSVTDAQGCTASANNTFPGKKLLDLQHTVELNTGTGNYWLYVRFLEDGFSWTDCLGSFVQGTVNGVSAPLTTAWTLMNDGTGRYRYNTAIAPGTTEVSWSSDGNVHCGNLFCITGTFRLYMPPVIATGDQAGVNVWLRAGLQGARESAGTRMNDGLRAAGLLPLIEPYSALGYNYAGIAPGASTTAAVLATTGNSAPVDWVVVEVRSPNPPYTLLGSRPALIQRDGDVMSITGQPYVHFGEIAAGSARVAIRHRNHLGAMTQVVSLANSAPVIDLLSSSQGAFAYGTSPLADAYFLWAGDATGNGTLSYSGASNDRDPILIAVGGTTPNNAVNNIYDRRDTNMDGMIKYTGANNDRDIILTNVGSTAPNNTRTQQLP